MATGFDVRDGEARNMKLEEEVWDVEIDEYFDTEAWKSGPYSIWTDGGDGIARYWEQLLGGVDNRASAVEFEVPGDVLTPPTTPKGKSRLELSRVCRVARLLASQAQLENGFTKLTESANLLSLPSELLDQIITFSILADPLAVTSLALTCRHLHSFYASRPAHYLYLALQSITLIPALQFFVEYDLGDVPSSALSDSSKGGKEFNIATFLLQESSTQFDIHIQRSVPLSKNTLILTRALTTHKTYLLFAHYLSLTQPPPSRLYWTGLNSWLAIIYHWSIRGLEPLPTFHSLNTPTPHPHLHLHNTPHPHLRTPHSLALTQLRTWLEEVVNPVWEVRRRVWCAPPGYAGEVAWLRLFPHEGGREMLTKRGLGGFIRWSGVVGRRVRGWCRERERERERRGVRDGWVEMGYGFRRQRPFPT